MREDSCLLSNIPTEVLYAILDYLPKTFAMSTLFLISKGTTRKIKKYILFNYIEINTNDTDEEKYQNFIKGFKELTSYTRMLVLNKTYKLSKGVEISVFQKSGIYEKVRFFMEMAGCTFSLETNMWDNSERINIPFLLKKFYFYLNPVARSKLLIQQNKVLGEKIKLVKLYCSFSQSKNNLFPLLDLLKSYPKELILQFLDEYNNIYELLERIMPITEQEKSKIEEFQSFWVQFKENPNNFPCLLDYINTKIAEHEILSFWMKSLKVKNNNVIDPFTLLYQMYITGFVGKEDVINIFEIYSPKGTSDEEEDFFNIIIDFEKINLSRVFVRLVVSPDCYTALTNARLTFNHIKQIQEKLRYEINEIQDEKEKANFVDKVSSYSLDDLIKNYINILQLETTVPRN